MNINTKTKRVTLTKAEIKELRGAAATVESLLRNHAAEPIGEVGVDQYLNKLADQYEQPAK